MSLLANRVADETMAEINVTPFTDVLLVLLIIFMILAAIVVPPGFEKRLSNNCNNCVVKTPQHPNVTVSVNADGRIFVGAQLVDENALYGALSTIARANRKTTVSFQADAKAPYRLVIRTLDAAKAAGLESVSFVSR